MDEPGNMSELVSEFAAITGASPLVADHYLSACNYDINRAVEFFFEHPPAPNQSGPRGSPGVGHDEDRAAAAVLDDDMDFGGGRAPGSVAGAPGDDDEELQRALVASMADSEPGGAAVARRSAAPTGRGPSGPGPATRRPQPDVEVIDDDEEELPDADAMLEAMARQREAALEADRQARALMEETIDRMLPAFAGRLAGTVNPPPNYPSGAMTVPFAGLPSLFPGMPGPSGIFPPGVPPAVQPLFGRGRDDGGGGGGSGLGAGSRGRNASGGGSGGGQSQQRRRVEVRRPDEMAGGGGGRRQSGWDDELELPEGMSRHELEEARMMEAALLGVPYEGRLQDFAGPRGGGFGTEADVAPEVLEHRELRWDQDRAYEESLAADRAKEQAAAKAKAEAEAQERALREAEEVAARAAAAEAARVAALVAAKAARLPPEPTAGAGDAINVMVRLPDGSRHSRRFARTDRLSCLFDFVDVELDTATKGATAAAEGAGAGAAAVAAAAALPGVAGGLAAQQSALKPGTYNLVTQFPRRVFPEGESGGKTFEEAGLAGGGGAVFFVEQTGG